MFLWGGGHHILTEGTFATQLKFDKLCGLRHRRFMSDMMPLYLLHRCVTIQRPDSV